MKNFEKLENFELENEKLKVVVGGNDPVTSTGGGSVTIPNHPSAGQSSTTTWTSDSCNADGSTRYLGKVTQVSYSLD
ncbi:hypothetical protein MQX03_09925 [Chryseobacterium aahli]|uniref:hypothetical protein n=1 Tax=Chryseobacterium aahli TaxID=1278643 RepID=UPI001F6259ED|nr:hypothetical protein [Chryseobacterium aahli]MCI3937520.1 hypothetical protein [Chryseobacterium aahli]